MIINILHNIIFCVQQKKVTQQKVWDNKRVVLNIFWLNSPFKFGLPGLSIDGQKPLYKFHKKYFNC